MANIIEILIKASNQASPELKKAAGDLGKLSKGAEQIGKGMRKAGLAITAGVTTPLAGLITKSTMAAAEVDTLDLVVKQLGKTAGYAEDEIMGHAEAVRKQGIEAAASREIIAKFVTAQLNAADAAGLARVAQNQAVIAGENSTATMERLTDALITGNSQMFRSLKMNVDLTSAYEAMADQLGKNVDELSETERVQARVNAVMEYGTTIAGTYEAAMGDSFKQMGSFKRYIDDISVAAGQYFTPALNEGVFAVGELLKAIPEMIEEGGSLAPVLESWGDAASGAAGVLANITERLKNLDPATAKTIGQVTGLTAVMGPLLLVGGQAVIWTGKLATSMSALGVASKAALGPLGLLAAAMAAVTVVAINQKNEFDALNSEILNTSETYEEYVRRSVKAAKEQGWIIDENGKAWHVYTGEANEAYNIMGPIEYAMLKMGVSIKTVTEDLSEYYEFVDGEWIPVQIKTKEVTEDATDAIDEHERALARAEARAKDYGGATDVARKALEELGVEAEEQARLMEELTGATEDKTAADLMLEEVNLRLTSLWTDNALSAERYNAALETAHGIAQDYPDALSPLLEMFGEWGSQVQNISDLLHGLPSQVRVDVIQTWYEAQGGTWRGAGNVGAGAGAGVVGDGGSVFARARGGPVYPGRVYRWQEFGPEYLVPQEQGQVMTPGQLAGISGGGGGNIYVTINTPINMADRAFVERELAPYIYDALDRAGRT